MRLAIPILLLIGAAAPAPAQCELGDLRVYPSGYFGWNVAIDGNRAIVANADANGPAAFVVELPSGRVIQRLFLPEGIPSAVDLEGDRAAIGYDTRPEFVPSWVYVYEVSTAKLLYAVTSDEKGWDNFGEAVEIEGDRLVVGAGGSTFGGIVYVYDLWTGLEQMQIHAPTPGGFGSALDVSGDVAVTARWSGPRVYVLDLRAGEIAREITVPLVSPSLSVATDGARVVVGDGSAYEKKGVAYVFDVATGTQLLRLSAPGETALDWFGQQVAIDGDLVAVVARPELDLNAVYFFDASTGEPRFELMRAMEGGLGWRGFALSGEHVLLGGPAEQEGEGRVHVYRRPTPTGIRYCPGTPNSTGARGLLVAEGSATAECNCLHLRASQLPVQQAAMLLVASARDDVPFAGGGQGTLCVGGLIARLHHLAGSTDANGSFRRWVDLERWPLGGSVRPGETWYFQAWYRDDNPGSTSNFTDAVSLTFR